MEETENSYTLTHETAEQTMTVHMAAGFKILVDFKHMLIVTSRNGEVKNKQTFEEMGSFANWEHHVERTNQDAENYKAKGLDHD